MSDTGPSVKLTGILKVPGMIRWVLEGAIVYESSEELLEVEEGEGG